DWITLSDWQDSVDDHVNAPFTAQIPVPVSVTKLLNELSEQVGMTLYWDAVAEQLRLISLAPAASGFNVTADDIMADSFDVTEQQDKRISQPWIYYSQRDTTKELDEEANYRRISVTVADNENDFAQSAIRKVYSRWISDSSTAERLGDLLLARYKIPPRQFKFDLFRTGQELPRLGSGVNLSHWMLVDEDGDPVSVAAQIISESAFDDHVSYEAEEVNYDGSADATKFVVIGSDSVGANLRTLYESTYGEPGENDD